MKIAVYTQSMIKGIQEKRDTLYKPLLALATMAVLLFLPSVFAQTTSPESDNADKSPVAMALEKEKKHAKLLSNFFKPGVVVWIKNADEQFLALHEPALQGQPKGVVLLIHDAGQHPNWQGPLSTLREYLPEKGWSTLSITLPDPETPKPPAPPTAEALAAAATNIGTEIQPTPGENESKEVFNDQTNSIGDGTFVPTGPGDITTREPSEIESIASDRIIAAIEYLQQQQINKVVIYGQGIGATRAAAYVQETGALNGSIQAIIMVDAYNTTPLKEYNLLLALNNPSLPVLDIQTLDTEPLRRDAKSRQNQARRNDLEAYQQIILSNDDSELIAKRIYGFLTRHFD